HETTVLALEQRGMATHTDIQPVVESVQKVEAHQIYGLIAFDLDGLVIEHDEPAGSCWRGGFRGRIGVQLVQTRLCLSGGSSAPNTDLLNTIEAMSSEVLSDRRCTCSASRIRLRPSERSRSCR